MQKTIVITGAGGVLCGGFAEHLGALGHKIALLDINEDAAKAVADKINNAGGTAFAYKCNCLDKSSISEVKDAVHKDLGLCDILINGAGGNNPKATTDNEYFTPEAMGNMKTFFDLDKSGVEFVFNLNFLGTLLPTQVFAKDMLDKEDASIINISSMNAYTPLTKIPAYSGAKAAISNFTQPSFELGYAIKISRVFILILCGLFKIWGLVIGLALVLLLIATTKTLGGYTYLYPIIPFNAEALKGLIIRRPKKE